MTTKEAFAKIRAEIKKLEIGVAVDEAGNEDSYLALKDVMKVIDKIEKESIKEYKKNVGRRV